MRKTLLIISIGVLLFGVCCSNDNGSFSNEVQIRVKNTSSFEYSDVRVNTSGGENNYGSILPNQLSDYKTYDFAFRYAYVELKIEGETFTLQPIDYVGEAKLKSGKYTFEINANVIGNQFDRLSLTLIEG